jgi:hypothetical protein
VTVIIGKSCANCGVEIPRPDAVLVYGTQIGLEAPNQAGVTPGIATLTFQVFRPDQTKTAMLLCDGCTGAALKAVCEGILADMRTLSDGDETTH